MDQKSFDTLARRLANLPSRRGLLRGMLGAGLGFAAARLPGAARAKPCRNCPAAKQAACKGKKQDGKPCSDGRGICVQGSCRCGDGPTCAQQDICQHGACFPRGGCPNGTQACVPESGTTCGDGCFCVTSAEENTICVQSAGQCIRFSDCDTAETCSTCQSSDDCPAGEACIDVSGCCDGVLRDTPLPAGTKTCFGPCANPAAARAAVTRRPRRKSS